MILREPVREIRGRLGPGRRVLREILVFAGFLLLTGAMLWPWPLHLRDGVSDPGDPYLTSWILWWDWHGTFTQPLQLFDGNIFFPYRYSLAFAENCWGISLLFFPLFFAGLPPLTIHGLATFVAFAFSGYGAFRAARTLTGSTGAAWVAGVGFAFVPYRFHLLPHMNYLFAGWIPLLLEALVLFLWKRTWKRAAWLGAAFLMNGLSVIHWMVLSLVPLAATGVLLMLRDRTEREPALFRRAAVSLGIASALLLPFLLPYHNAGKLYGFRRSAGEAATYSARPRDWLTADPAIRVWSELGIRPVPDEKALFPGLTLLALAALALLAARPAGEAGAASGGANLRQGLRSRRRPEIVWIGATWALLGFLGSLGMKTPFHRTLYEFVPLFRIIRVPARWAMIADLGLALLAGYGALLVFQSLARRRPPAVAAAVVFGGLSVALLWEDHIAPYAVLRGDVDPDEVTLRLKATPMKGGIVELPTGSERGNFLFVLRAADHGKPLVNGTSGFMPPIPDELERLTKKRPVSAAMLDLLESVPVSYVVVRESWLTPDSRPDLHALLAEGLSSGRLRFVRRFDGHARNDLYAVVKTEPDAVSEMPCPWQPEPPAAGTGLRKEDSSLTGGLDDPAEGSVVQGPLLVRGWARVPGGNLDVTVLIDGEAREAISRRRVDRGDVARVLPRLGDCAGAGFEERYEFQPGDEGPHEIRVVFRKQEGGAIRHYPLRRFVWRN